MNKKQVHSNTLVRAADLKKMGYTRFQIPSLLRRGKIVRISRGLYKWGDVSVTAHYSISSVGKLITNGIVCLLSALRYYNLGTQSPESVWVAVPSNYKTPRLSSISITVVHFSDLFRKIGVQNVIIDGVSVKITTPARTVVDCFRFRNKIGVNVAIEALEDAVRRKMFTSDEIVTIAQQCRIYSVIKPYLETIYR